MPTLNRQNMPMETLGDFERFTKQVYKMYSSAIRDEVEAVGEHSSYLKDLRRQRAEFQNQVRKVRSFVGSTDPQTRLIGNALEEARHMLLLGH